MKSIRKKIYYRAEFTLISPLALSSGVADSTDKDLMVDGAGQPYIPASAIAGATKEILEKRGLSEINRYFGFVDKNISKSRDNSRSEESKLIFYDAVIKETEGNPQVISIRDSVALDEFKTAKSGAKFDMEVLEPGTEFITLLEQDVYDQDFDFAFRVVKALCSEEIRFGAKSMRGYGKIRVDRIERARFSFNPEEGSTDTPADGTSERDKMYGLEDWLEFSPYEDALWSDVKNEILKDLTKDQKSISFTLKLEGGISIRKYTTKPSSGNESQPDMEQLTVHSAGKEELPTIPGTSWAGAFIHRMKDFGMSVQEMKDNFGFVMGEGKNDKGRSKVRFSETEIHGAKEKILSRTSIDRFTGGAVDEALFTEKTYYGGTTTLDISWLGKEDMPPEIMDYLAAALTDLHYGFLAVGGETSIGRGLFSIVSVNVKKVAGDDIDVYSLIRKEIEASFAGKGGCEV